MPDFYLRRVERNFGHTLPADAFASYKNYASSVISIANQNYTEFNTDQQRFQKIKAAIKKLKEREIEVIIARLPMTGQVEAIADIRFPQALWEEVTSEFGATIIDYRDYPQLAYELPDGSHLGLTQKAEFTLCFADILLQQDVQDQS